MYPPLTPRPLSDPQEIQLRLGLLHEPHISALTTMVEQIREDEHICSVPWFDPMGGGVNAKVLLLLQDPSDTAQNGTGFISPDNPDPTANNTTWFRDKACLRPMELIHWNIIPWMMTGSFSNELNRASPYLKRLLCLLQNLKIIVCMGIKSEKGWNKIQPDNPCKKGWIRINNDELYCGNLIVLACPHPSNQGIGGANRTRMVDDRTPSQRIIDTLKNVRLYLDH